MVWAGTRVLLFGGSDGGMTFPDDTWAFDAGDWADLAPATTPPGRFGHKMVWDGTRVLMFGGADLTGYLNDMWEFVGGDWNELSPATVPDARAEFGMVWDGSRVLLYGGIGDFGLGGDYMSDETWEYVAGNWNQLSPSNAPGDVGTGHTPGAPDGRHRFGMVWNGTRAVLFAGESYVNAYPTNPYYETDGPTWVYESADWTQPDPASSAQESYGHMMTVTDDDGKALLYGGDVSPTGSFGEIVLDQTWAYDDVDWTQLAPSLNPGKRIYADLVWDTIRRRGILFGGIVYATPTSSARSDETWEFAGPTPPPVVASLRHTFGLA